MFNPLSAELNPICHLLTLLGAHHILHVSRIRDIRDAMSPGTCTGLLDSGNEGTTILRHIGNYLQARGWQRPEDFICHNVVPRISNVFVKC
jgi:hypothetical protein